MPEMQKNAVAAAAAFARASHEGQMDRQGLPYILHPLAVMAYVTEHPLYSGLSAGEQEDICCIALLHDVVEDTEVTVETIRQRFGGRVADGVLAMTHHPDEAIEAYWTRVKKDRLARIVKLSDFRHNSEPSRQVANPEDRQRLAEKYRRGKEFLAFPDEACSGQGGGTE